ncbi:hypothetical protein BC831DRAFT_456863 [Entophlyctis helioformis]|nr:hypothetical protein BC831DRAFT_456863 [Entophlyctis helioformis]
MDLNAATTTTTTTTATAPAVVFEVYDTSESQLPQMMALIDSDLSEPYSVFTYRYFLRMSPSVSFVARDPALPAGSDVIGTVICKLESHRDQTLRGYIAMLAVAKPYRKHGIGSELVKRAVTAMRNQDADEVRRCTKETCGGRL